MNAMDLSLPHLFPNWRGVTIDKRLISYYWKWAFKVTGMVGRMGRLGEITIKISDQTLQSSKNCFLATIHNGLEIEKYCKVYFYLFYSFMKKISILGSLHMVWKWSVKMQLQLLQIRLCEGHPYNGKHYF